MSTARVTNDVFAEKVGCDFTTASRLRNGNRKPSFDLFLRITRAFELDRMDALTAYEAGQESFGQYLRDNVFAPDAPDSGTVDDSEDSADDHEERTA
jgi:hypothetical protein